MPFSDLTALKTYINANIVTNGAASITGAKMNEVLNGILQFTYEEATLTTTLASNETTIVDSALEGAVNVRVYSSVRLIDNDTVGTPVADGFTFDPVTGTITFASTRGKGETFVIDYKKPGA